MGDYRNNISGDTISNNISSITGILTYDINTSNNSNKILVINSNELPFGFLGYIVYGSIVTSNTCNVFRPNSTVEDTVEGSIVKLDFVNNYFIELVCRDAKQVDLYITGECTQDCISCPQPRSHRRKIDPQNQAKQIAELLWDGNYHINISGGEPTYNKKYFVDVVNTVKRRAPNASIQILSNGIAFSGDNYIDEIINWDGDLDRLKFSFAFYGSNKQLHDFITKTPGSYDNLVAGVNNLLNRKANIEIRIVISKLNFNDISNMAKMIVGDLPNVNRVILMGLEMSGEALTNKDIVWIPFYEHEPILSETINILMLNNIQVYLYNYPLCYLKNKWWSISKDSISGWKKRYLEDCAMCKIKDKCPGFFESTLPFINNVYPVL